MNCKTFLICIARSLDSELPEGEKATLEAHLKTCASCKAEWEAQLRLRQMIQSLQATETPDSVLAAIRRRLSQGEAKRIWLEDIESFARHFVPIAAMLLLALSGLAARNTWKRYQHAPELEWLVVAQAPDRMFESDDVLYDLTTEEDGVPSRTP